MKRRMGQSRSTGIGLLGPGTASVRALTAYLAILLALLLGATPAAAQSAASVPVAVDTSQGFGRLLFDVPESNRVSAELRNTVLVINFSRPVSIDEAQLQSRTSRFVAMVRHDADGKTLRLALSQPLRLATSRSPTQVAIDLLPPAYKGEPPSITPPPPPPPEPEPEPVAAPIDPGPPMIPANEPLMRVGATNIGPIDTLPIQVTSNDIFTRVLFRWAAPVAYRVVELDGSVRVDFDRQARPLLAELRVDPPKPLLGGEADYTETGLVVSLDVARGTTVRHNQDEDGVVVDLIRPEAAKAVITPAPAAHGDDPHTPAPKTDHHDDPHAPPAAAPPAPAAPAAPGHGDDHSAAPDETGHAIAAVPMSAAPAVLAIGVERRDDSSVLTFPWGAQVPAAVFARGSRLWAVFDRPGTIDLAPLVANRPFEIAGAEILPDPDLTIVRFTVPEGVLVNPSFADGTWSIALGQAPSDPNSRIGMRKVADDQLGARIEFSLPRVHALHRITDPDVGDEIVVATALAPAIGLFRPLRLAELETLSSQHGLALRPLTDDLSVTRRTDRVVVTRQGGLLLSDAVPAVELVRDVKPQQVGSPAFMDFAAWRGDTARPFADREQALLAAIAASEERLIDGPRLDLARFYIGNELNAEAMGVLRAVRPAVGLEGEDPHVLALRGVASLRNGNSAEAGVWLGRRELADDPHASLWRALTAATASDWQTSLSEFAKGEAILSAYPSNLQAEFRLAAAEAAFEMKDLATAQRLMAGLQSMITDPRLEARRRLLEAEILDALGSDKVALEIVEDLEFSRLPDIAARAQLGHVRLGRETNTLTPEAAIDSLEALRFRWRGDDLEAEVHVELSRLYCEVQRYRDCLATLKRAINYFPKHPLVREMWHQSTSVFRSLFLDGKAAEMPPVEALALYYDFKELTPIGQDGDAMIRQLANRLVEIDLLPQAAQLLDHQVTNRLRGVAKAQVAARLATIQLLDRKPAEALSSLRASYQARLPHALSSQRTQLEATALARLGRVEHALEVIDGDTTRDGRRLKADILWDAQRWVEAARAYEQLADEGTVRGRAPTEAERAVALRAAISFSLAGEAAGLERVRLKYTAAMAESTDARAFDVVTAPIERQGLEFSEMVRRIASVDALQGFLASLDQDLATKAEPVTN